MNRLAAVFAALLITGCEAHLQVSSGPSPRDEILHKDGKPCPSGWTEKPAFFTERDGSQVSACVADKDTQDVKPGIDEMRDGESIVAIPIQIAVPIPGGRNIV